MSLQASEQRSIVLGAEYVYTSNLPRGCKGHRYRAHRFVLDVPTYQEKVLVEALTGHDAGLWFTVALQNFSLRYQLANFEEPADA